MDDERNHWSNGHNKLLNGPSVAYKHLQQQITREISVPKKVDER